MNHSSSHNERWKLKIQSSLGKEAGSDLSEEEKAMLEEAVEGLSHLENDTALNKSVAEINKNLRLQVQKRKKRGYARRDHIASGRIWLVTLILLILICITFWYIAILV